MLWLPLLLLMAPQSIEELKQPAERKLGPPPVYQARFTAAPPKLDGLADDAAWRAAAPVEFVFPWDSQKGAKQKTSVRLAWDASFLYALYECDDADITVKHTQRDDPTYKDDAVELYVNPRSSQSTAYYGFEMNANGVMYDYFLSYPEFGLLSAYNAQGWQIATKRNDKGWSLELAIPWANFSDLSGSRLAPKPGDSWRFNLVRWDGTEPARRLSMYSDSGLKLTVPHRPARFATLKFIESD
jgi:hypothetical protein